MQQKNHRSISLLLFWKCFLLICLPLWTLPTFLKNKKNVWKIKSFKHFKKRNQNLKKRKKSFFTSTVYELCLTIWKTLRTAQPLYLSELISHYLPSRSLRSSNANLLVSNFSSQAFLSLHHIPGTLYVYTFVLLTSYQPSNAGWNPISSSLLSPSSHPVPASEIRFTIFGDL